MAQRTAGGATTLPGKYYTSEEIYRRESERIFSRRWLYADRSARIATPGSYFLHEIDGESLIILRNRQGELRAFYNLCRHRGTRLCEAAEGHFAKSIRCPYHAWSYNLDGELTGAPNMREVAGFAKTNYSLHPVAAAEWAGNIFLNLSPTPPALQNTLAAVWHKFDNWRLPELTTVHRTEYEVRANWKLILQNYSECYHCPTLHPQLNRLTPYRNSSNDLESGPILGGPMQLSQPAGSMTLSGQRCAPPLPGVAPQDRQQVYYYVFFPNMLLSLHPDYVLIHRVDRLDIARSRVVCLWLFHAEAVARPDFDPGGAIEFWDMTNRQDWHVCELSQHGVASRAYVPGPYAELESMIAALDREYLTALGEPA